MVFWTVPKEDKCVLCTRKFPTSGNHGKETMQAGLTQLSLTIPLFFLFNQFTHPLHLYFSCTQLNLSIVETFLVLEMHNALDRHFSKLYNIDYSD